MIAGKLIPTLVALLVLASCSGESHRIDSVSDQPTSPQPSTAATPITPPVPATINDVRIDLRTGIATPLPTGLAGRDSRSANYDVAPSGKLIAFDKLVNGKIDIFVAHLDGTHRRRITRVHWGNVALAPA